MPPDSDLDWENRARLGRATRQWLGGLDGPPPSWEELEQWCRDVAYLRSARYDLEYLRSALARYDAACGAEALGFADRVIRSARSLTEGVARDSTAWVAFRAAVKVAEAAEDAYHAPIPKGCTAPDLEMWNRQGNRDAAYQRVFESAANLLAAMDVKP